MCHGDHSAGRRRGALLSSILIGLASLAWLIFRTGTKPSRIVYPCQRAAASTSWVFLAAPLAALAASRFWRRPAFAAAVVAVVGGVALGIAAPGLTRSAPPTDPERAAEFAERIACGVGESRGFPGRVVAVHDTAATFWDYGSDYYGDYVDQDVVDAMVAEGLLALTGTHSIRSAWEAILPDFAPGQKLAIKVNLNNATDPPSNDIDALIHPVNALLGGLIAYGFAPGDITVFDVTNAYHQGIMPERFSGACEYPGVVFEAYVGNPEPWDLENKATFSAPSGPGIADCAFAACLTEADYLINVAVAKAHDYAGVSLTFKNHLGSINHCDRLHNYIFPSFPYYSPDYNPLLELNVDEQTGGKTVLAMVDCLFGNWEHLNTPPTPWPSYGGAPNTIFLATDAVAIDCVAIDHLAREGNVPETADDYLVLAGAAGMGTFERASTFGVYSVIDYEYLEAPFEGTGVADPGEPPALPDMLSVLPNPSAGPTTVRLSLPVQLDHGAVVRLYNCRGQVVRRLLEADRATGEQEIVWNGRDDAGERVGSGVYWCVLEYAGRREVEKLTVLR